MLQAGARFVMPLENIILHMMWEKKDVDSYLYMYIFDRYAYIK